MNFVTPLNFTTKISTFTLIFFMRFHGQIWCTCAIWSVQKKVMIEISNPTPFDDSTSFAHKILF